MSTRRTAREAPQPERAEPPEEAAASDAAGKGAPAVIQAVRVLRCLSQAPAPMGVTAVAREVGLSPSSCFNVLRALVGEGLLNFDQVAKTYALGLGLVELASPALGLAYLDLIRPVLLGLAVRFDCLVALWQVTSDERLVLVERFHSDAPLRIELRAGQRLPAYAGAVGRAVAAHAGLNEAQLMHRFSQFRWHQPPEFATYAAEVAKARRDGFAIDRGQLLRGIEAVGVAVLDQSGRPRLGIGSLNIAGHQSEARLQELGVAMREAAAQISRSLRWMQRLPEPSGGGRGWLR